MHVEWLLSEILTKYHEWHPFKVYEFELYKINNNLVKNDEINKETKLLNLIDDTDDDNIRIMLIESELSKLRRKKMKKKKKNCDWNDYELNKKKKKNIEN